MKVTGKDMVLGALQQAALYNFIEVALVVIVGFVHFIGLTLWTPFLWLMFGAAALWTVLASTKEAQEDAEELVMYREVFITDFLVGAVLLLVLSSMTVQYGLQYGTIFLVAAIQNLRYSALAYNWLREEDDDSKRDNLP